MRKEGSECLFLDGIECSVLGTAKILCPVSDWILDHPTVRNRLQQLTLILRSYPRYVFMRFTIEFCFFQNVHKFPS